jgi:hypothetical protein
LGLYGKRRRRQSAFPDLIYPFFWVHARMVFLFDIVERGHMITIFCTFSFYIQELFSSTKNGNGGLIVIFIVENLIV